MANRIGESLGFRPSVRVADAAHSFHLDLSKETAMSCIFSSLRRAVARPAVVSLLGLAATAALVSSPATAASLSSADQAFVAKVSQGGMFEVVASKVGVDRADAQDVKDLAISEVHDHELVGSKLKSIASANGVDLEGSLNADFQGRVDRLKALSGKAFDAAYLKEMERIHALDGAAFAKEATSGQNADLRAFSAETVKIVHRHIGALKAPV
jgi:putative membrane protein